MNVDLLIHTVLFKDTVYMSNPAQEITLSKILDLLMTKKVRLHCVFLPAVNVGVLKELDDLEELCDLAVRFR